MASVSSQRCSSDLHAPIVPRGGGRCRARGRVNPVSQPGRAALRAGCDGELPRDGRCATAGSVIVAASQRQRRTHDAIALLKADHDKVKKLLTELEATTER